VDTIKFSQALEGYFLDARARQLSPKTIEDYQNGFRHFREYLKTQDTPDPELSAITADDIRYFLAYLRAESISPDGIAPRPARKLSKKSVANIHVALSSLWTWAMREGFVAEHVVRMVSPPKPEKPAIKPFSQTDVEAMLEACQYSRPYKRPGKAKCRNERPTAQRDRAIILLLLDTGIRASEAVENPTLGTTGLLVRDVDRRNSRIKVWGKGSRERIIPVSTRTMKAIWRYLLERPDAQLDDPLFIGYRGGAFTTSGLGQLIKRLGEKAGVQNAHPHRFRHTFATNMLRNGANALQLKHMLGHSSMKMVQRYVEIANCDVEQAHRRASPVSNWRL
jgi:integrase/recombinase XerD